MVFIKDIESAKRASDVASHREKIQEYLVNLQSITDTEDDLYRLRTMSSNLKMLCDRKKISEETKARHREYQRKRYALKKDEILQKNKERRKKMRSLRENLELGGDISTVISG